MLAKTVIVLAIVMNFQPRRTVAEWKPVQTGLDDGGVGPRHYDQYEASAEDPEMTEDAGDGEEEETLRTMNLMDFADRKPAEMNDNSDYVLASSSSSSADEDSADASSGLNLGGYMEGATETQNTDSQWPAGLSAPPSRMKRDASNPHTSALQQLKPHKTVGAGVGVGASKALSVDMKDWPLLRSKRRTRSQAELQRMVILDNLLNEFSHRDSDDDDGNRQRINGGYGVLKRIPASSYLNQSPPTKSRVAAGMRYAGIGKRKVNVRSRVDAGMRYMGIGKRHY